MGFIFEDEQFSYQMLRIIGETASGAADIGEVLETASRIKEGDFESWCKEWLKTADRIKAAARSYLNGGNTESARTAFLRASNYYRAAEFYLHDNPDDPRIMDIYNFSLDAFEKSMKFTEICFKKIQIPYEDTTLPGYFFAPDSSTVRRPVVIAMTGFDGTKEEMYGVARAANARGINCLAFEGPGQGEVVRRQGLKFRHDWEKVISPVIDHLLGMNQVDPDRLVLWGESFGGYLAPRAAAFETRLRACVANGGVVDFQGFRRPPEVSRRDYFESIEGDISGANAAIKDLMSKNTELRWAMNHGMYVFGAESPADWVIKCEPYHLYENAEKIKCETLIIDTENEQSFPGQAKPLFDLLTCKKEFMFFTAAEGAQEHCQVGARMISSERIFNWIENAIR